MEILGIGPLELIFILIIALIVLGPNDMVKAGRTLGRWMRKIVTSPTWQTIQQTSRDLRTLPNRLIREAGIEEQEMNQLRQEMSLDSINQELKQDLKTVKTDLSAWTTTPTGVQSTSDSPSDPTIASPVEQPSATPGPDPADPIRQEESDRS